MKTFKNLYFWKYSWLWKSFGPMKLSMRKKKWPKYLSLINKMEINPATICCSSADRRILLYSSCWRVKYSSLVAKREFLYIYSNMCIVYIFICYFKILIHYLVTWFCGGNTTDIMCPNWTHSFPGLRQGLISEFSF